MCVYSKEILLEDCTVVSHVVLLKEKESAEPAQVTVT